MNQSLKNQKFKFNPESRESLDDKESQSYDIVLKSQSCNFWDNFMLPTPEQQIEAMIKDEEKLEELIKDIKDVLIKIEEAEKLKDYESEESKDSIESVKNHYTSLLEEFENELQCIKVQHKSMNIILDENYDSENDDFEKNIPELIANFMVSSEKKIKEVNDVVKTIEKKSKNNRIEECIQCFAIIKDHQGRKTSIEHIHLNDKLFDSFKKYKPVICLECFKELNPIINIDNIKESTIDSENVCKKGSKIYSKELLEEIPAFIEKYNKYIKLENEEFINSIKIEEKKSFFDFKI